MKCTKTAFALVAFLALSWVATASAKNKDALQQKKGQKPEVTVEFQVNPSKSSVEWIGRKVLKGQHQGSAGVKSGVFQFNQKNVLVGGVVQIDMDSIQDKDLSDEEDRGKLTTHLKSEDFFDVKQWPTATFKLTGAAPQGSIQAGSDTRYLVSGMLKIRDVERPISFPMDLHFSGEVAEGKAELSLDRTKWNIRYNSKQFFKNLVADRVIADQFDLKLNLVAEKHR